MHTAPNVEGVCAGAGGEKDSKPDLPEVWLCIRVLPVGGEAKLFAPEPENILSNPDLPDVSLFINVVTVAGAAAAGADGWAF